MTTRLSKIARLPAVIREQLNRRLHNGELGKTLLPWLNSLPETKRVLAELFEGKPVTHQNLSEWRRAGYQDWFLLQHRLQWFDRLTEQETEIEKNQCGDACETMGWHFLYEIGQGLAELQNIKNPDRRLTKLQTLTREFARLQNAFNWSRRVQLEFDRFNRAFPPEPEQPIPQIEENHDTEEGEEEEYYTEDDTEIGEQDTATAKAPPSEQLTEVPASLPDTNSGTDVSPVSPCSHGRDTRATMEVHAEAAPNVQADQTGSLGAPACPSEPWRSGASRRPESPDLYELARENANLKPECQPIPALAPTTPQPPHHSLRFILGRRFKCIEG